ncbi:MAG: type I methionyl aminopeptidase [Deltaproteobacteria bacterium]|nr:type I methionyl aminopeptidase [Deltaproteobacteria bacterium]
MLLQERKIELKSPREIEIMRRAGHLVGEILQQVAAEARPGMSTLDLDALAERLTLKAGAKPAFKNYRGYRHTICASVNDQVVHGVPSRAALQAGDIIGIDFGVILEGFYGDSAITLPVGEISDEARRLLEAGKEALERGIAQAAPDKRLGDIGAAVQTFVEDLGYSVVREMVGHGIGRALHEEPQVPNYGRPDTGARLRPGMVLAIEPMINVGGSEIETLDDGWTVVTEDGSLSAHFEHTVAITEHGPEVLTRL